MEPQTQPMRPTPETTPALRLQEVSYAYPVAQPEGEERAVAVERISLDIQQGEYVALLGHNGSGKSTVARLLNALLLPTEGHVLIDGLDTADKVHRSRIRELVGMIFSDPDNQIIATVVEDDVAWGLAARGWPASEIAVRVDEALRAVGLLAARRRPPHELSGGQRQRLAIASVLALTPKCIVADEPTALLDPQARREMTGLLRQLNRERGLTIVHVTHLLEEAANADRIIVLENGRVALDGPPAAIFLQLDTLRQLRLVIPELAELGERLRQAGIPIPPTALTPAALVSALDAAT